MTRTLAGFSETKARGSTSTAEEGARTLNFLGGEATKEEGHENIRRRDHSRNVVAMRIAYEGIDTRELSP